MPIAGAPLPAPLTPPRRFLIEEREQGVYFIDHVDIGERWHLLGGLRYGSYEFVSTGNTLSDDSGLSPSLGAVYDLTPQLSVYAGWSRSFEGAFGQDVQGRGFDPQKGEQFEIGVKGDAFGKRLFYTLALFDLTQTNVITADPNNPGFSAPLGKVNIRGVELDLAAQLTDRLGLIAALTYHDSEITENNEGFEGQRLANTPEWAGTLRLSYRATADLRLGGSLIHVGDRQGANFGIPFQVDGYTRLDLDASWRVPQVPGLTLFASVENLLDEDYVLGSRDATQIQLGRPQTFTLRARYAF